MLRLDSKVLKQIIKQVLLKEGVNENSVFNVSESMVETSLRGVDSHGINLFPHYHNSYLSGRINKEPRFRFNSNYSTTFILDADHAVGHHSGIVAMNKCIEVADSQGIGVCAVKNSSHYGASSYFGLHAARRGFIGMAFTNADALVKSYGGIKSFFGTNPICFCTPLMGEEPLCLDMATSQVSWNKIKNYRRNNKDLEAGWAYNEKGEGVIDPNAAKSLSPAGNYKGFGLGLMVEVLCSVLTNSILSKDMLPMFDSPPAAQRQVSHFFIAININAFGDKNSIIQDISSMIDRLRAEHSLSGTNVMAPGDPEKHEYNKRVKSGIPCDKDVFSNYLKIDSRFEKCILNKN